MNCGGLFCTSCPQVLPHSWSWSLCVVFKLLGLSMGAIGFTRKTPGMIGLYLLYLLSIHLKLQDWIILEPSFEKVLAIFSLLPKLQYIADTSSIRLGSKKAGGGGCVAGVKGAEASLVSHELISPRNAWNPNASYVATVQAEVALKKTTRNISGATGPKMNHFSFPRRFFPAQAEIKAVLETGPTWG